MTARSKLAKINKIPIIFGIILPVLVLFSGIFTIDKVRTLKSSANADKQPQQVRIANITEGSFVVSWVTTETAEGSVFLGDNSTSLDREITDVRDTGKSEKGAYINHFVFIESLLPQKNYFFAINSGGVTFLNSDKPYEVKTAITKTPSDSDVAQGTILKEDGSVAPGVLVYLSLANSIPQAALTDNQGHWMVPLSTARSTDLSNLSSYDRTAQIIEILAVDGNKSATAMLATKNDNPSPDITLGNTYNFVNQSRTENSPTPTIQQVVGGDPDGFGGINPSTNTGLTITYPSVDEKVTVQIPEFFGTGPAGEKIKIEVHSDKIITANTPIDTTGSWRWSPTEPLPPGEHTITVSYTDKDGFVKKVTKNFIVLATNAAENEYLPSFTATGSGRTATSTPTSIPQPTNRPTVAPLTPTLTPTRPATATLIPTVSTQPLATNTPAERTSLPNGAENIPTSGNLLPTIVAVSLGVIIFVVGIGFLIF